MACAAVGEGRPCGSRTTAARASARAAGREGQRGEADCGESGDADGRAQFVRGADQAGGEPGVLRGDLGEGGRRRPDDGRAETEGRQGEAGYETRPDAADGGRRGPGSGQDEGRPPTGRQPKREGAAIARAAGVSRVTLYSHLPTREALLDALDRAVTEAAALEGDTASRTWSAPPGGSSPGTPPSSPPSAPRSRPSSCASTTIGSRLPSDT
ncbi:hypothetical protein [Streptomyces sp. NPDC054849]